MNNSWIEDQYGSEVAQLAADYQAKKFSRRSFLGRLTAVGFSVGAASSILAACGSSSSDSAAVDTTVAPDLTPKVGGTLREGYPRDISKHDPITSNWYDPAFSAIYETIVTDGLEGDTVPQFASAYEVSEDGLTYTFEIPEGRVSHSGGAMGAQQVSELLQTIKDTSFIGGVSTVPMEGYSFEGNKVFMKMKNAWL